jgi:hypothetical protein
MLPGKLPTQRFTTAFGVSRGSADDWYDPFLERDTLLFVDPFLIAEDDDPHWQALHEKLVGFFNHALELIAKSYGNEHSQHWKKAAHLFRFPEPPEFCLGYGHNSIHGHGSGRKLGQTMLHGAMEAISEGITHVDHMEDIALFGGGIGADLISDIACNVLKADFIEYTQEVANRHSVKMEQVPTRHPSWSQRFLKWDPGRKVLLPRNPNETFGVLLVPHRFLRELPTLDPAEFWEYAYDNFNDDLRTALNYEIARNADMGRIRETVRRRPDLVRRYIMQRILSPPSAYDVARDPRYKHRWFDDARALASAFSTTKPGTETDVPAFVRQLCTDFKHSVEHRGWSLLWDGDKSRRETHAQVLFGMSVVHACRAADVDVSPEADVGVGPVDFKFSQGWRKRALVELKLAKSTSFWRNLDKQLPAYLEAERIAEGFFVIVQYTDNDVESKSVKLVTEALEKVNKSEGTSIEPIFVDARKKRSASKR